MEVINFFTQNQTLTLNPNADYQPDTIFLIAEAILLLLSPLNILVIIISACIILKSIQFHKNLITLIISTFVHGILYFICRMILIIRLFSCTENCFENGRFMFSSTLIAVDLIRITVGIGYLFSMWYIFLERALATIKFSTYEKHTDYIFIFICIVGQYFWGFVLTLLMYKETLNFLYFLGMGELGCVLFSLSFILFDRINQRRYRKSITIGNNYTLSQRYQLAENIRSSNFLKKFIMMVVIFNSFIIMMFALMWLIDKQSQKRWAYFAYELAISIYAFSIPIIVIFSCDMWKRIFLRFLRRIFAYFKRTKVENTVSIQQRYEKLKTSNGKKMVFVVEQEAIKIFLTKNQSNVDTDADYQPDAIFLIAEAILLLLSPLNILVLTISSCVILKSIQFHKNLITLIINLFVEGILYFICRMILIINLFGCTENCFDNGRFMLSSSLIAVDLIRLTVGIAYLISMMFVFMERAIATIKWRTYEKHSVYFYIFSCVFGQYFLGFVFTYLLYREVFHYFYFFGLGEVGTILFSFSFIFFDRINQRRYQHSITIGNNYTLSQRYQIAENIRSSNFMKKAILVYTIFNSFILMIFASIWIINKQSQKRWAYFAYELAISIYAFALPIIVIYSCDVWKRIFLRTLRTILIYVWCKGKKVGDLISAQEKLKTSNGKNMIFVAEQEGRIYFQNLHKLWG